MKVDERTVRSALHELAEHTVPSESPVAAIMRRGQRARRTRRAGLAGACAGLVAVMAVSAVGLARPHQAPDEAVTPQMRLAAALEATGKTSFRLAITQQADPDERKGRTVRYTGAYEPATGTGYLSGDKQTGIWAQRIVGGMLYIQQGPDTWYQYSQCRRGFYFDNLKSGDGGTLSSAGLSADPAQLLDLLRGSGKVVELGRQGSGVKAVDRYRFAAVVQASLSGGTFCGEPSNSVVYVPINVTGEVEVGARSGKVRTITYRDPLLEATPVAAGDGQYKYQWRPSSTDSIKITIQMSDYGLPVLVKAPSHWQPA
jgi:hypothetical protein